MLKASDDVRLSEEEAALAESLIRSFIAHVDFRSIVADAAAADVRGTSVVRIKSAKLETSPVLSREAIEFDAAASGAKGG